MADMFRREHVLQCLMNKHILFLGGSNVRGSYKDLIWFLQSNSLTADSVLKRKLEQSCLSDDLVKGDKLHNGRHYVEDRSYCHEGKILVEYSFISRCYSPAVISKFEHFRKEKLTPDLIIMNSTLWDINRYGPNGIEEYKQNMINLMKLVKKSISKKCLFLWVTAPPVSQEISSSLLVEEIEFLKYSMRFNVMEANTYARQIVGAYGYDVLDLHYYCRMLLRFRNRDGVHFQPLLVRYMTNLILTHCCLSWNIALPGTGTNISLENAKRLVFLDEEFETDADKILAEIEEMAPNKTSDLSDAESVAKSTKKIAKKSQKNQEGDLMIKPVIKVAKNSNKKKLSLVQRKAWKGNGVLKTRLAPYDKNCNKSNKFINSKHKKAWQSKESASYNYNYRSGNYRNYEASNYQRYL